MKKLFAGVVVSIVASLCHGQECGVNTTVVAPPAHLIVERVTTFSAPPDGAVPIVAASQAFAYATAIGVFGCDVVVMSNGGPNYYWASWPVDIVASGGTGELHTVIGGVGATAHGQGPVPVPVLGTSTLHVEDWRSFSGYEALADAAVGGGAPFTLIVAVVTLRTEIGPEVIGSINDQQNPDDNTASWGWGGAAAIASAWVNFTTPDATQVVVDDHLSLNYPTATGRRRFVVPIPAGGPAPVVVSPFGFVAPGWTSQPGGGQLLLDRQVFINVTEKGTGVGVGHVTGDDALFDADCDGRFTQADIGIVVGWVGTVVGTLPEAAGSCAHNSDGTPNKLAAAFDINQDGLIGIDDVAQVQGILDSLSSIGQQAGIFGDVNRDGVLDCTDLAAAGVFWDTTLGDAAYTPALDFDLDGRVNASDQDHFFAISKFATDFDRSGYLTPSDVAAFVNAWYVSDARADFDHDGSLTPADIAGFVNAFFAGCS